MEILLSQIESAEKSAIEWLMNAYSHGNGGFPHSRWTFLPGAIAWNRDYAETTGYLIENLLVFNAKSDHRLSEIAASAGNWLLAIQSPEGYFHSGTQHIKPSAFNTAQVLFGLDILYSQTNDESYFQALSKAFNWLLASIDERGIIKRGLYVEGFYSAYYTRALWLLLLVDQKYFNSKHEMKLLNSLAYLSSYENQYGFFNNCGFHPAKVSLLHTIAYTLEGFYECSKLNWNHHMQSYILQILDRICEIIQQHEKTPAFIYPNFESDFSFICVSGQAQICALLLKANADHENPVYKKTAMLLFKQLLDWQIKSNSVEHNGALHSSIPVWKNYFPFRYTNWTMKFFLDACALMKRIIVE